MVFEKNQQAFFVLVKAGLWEKDERLLSNEGVDYDKIFKLAEEQSVIGLVAAGLEHIANLKPQKELVLEYVGQALQLEQRNKAMNYFIDVMVEKIREAGIELLLVKGQGVAQCYERPLWRSCGDVDFLLNEENYCRAKAFFKPLADSMAKEGKYTREQELTIDPWVIELHGTLRTELSSTIDRYLDVLKDDATVRGCVRVWRNGNTDVLLPNPDIDVIFIFTHFLKHFYKGGIGLRQICDWCRLIWIFRSDLDTRLLAKRLVSMKLMTEWKAFSAFAVEYLGMPSDALPFYSPEAKWKRKAARISSFIIEVGNFGHNRDQSYMNKYPFIIRKAISFVQRCKDILRHMMVFPMNSIRFLPSIIFNGMRNAVNVP